MRSLIRVVLACALLFGSAGAASAQTTPAPGVPAAPAVGMAAGILVDTSSGKVLWARNPDVARPPASLTKVLTALVALEEADLDENVTISAEARGVGGARVYVEAGWVLPARDLLWAMLLKSGNDASIALAQKVSPDGTVAGFAQIMNQRAQELGARHSAFVNPHGLDAGGHVATPRDLAIITAAALRNPTFAQMVATVRHDIPWTGGGTMPLVNHNKLLARYPGTIGVKTGFTNGAGHSLISAVTRSGHTLILVAMGVPPSPGHYAESIALYDWAFANLPGLIAGAQSQLPPMPPPKVRGAESARAADAAPRAEVEGLAVVQLASAPDPVPAGVPVTTVVGLTGVALAGIALRRRRPPRVRAGAAPAGRPALRLGPELRRSRSL